MTAATTGRTKAKRKAPGAAPPPLPRYEGGTWRPNAPGWPAQPHIPAHLQRAEEE